ncbi:MAG: hypothetical protein K0S08_1697 [Gammaproteobacteria bacterium]|jgi:GNAT superfamily N-acetyltransferase|nr:hypothetical protein [Gammaproteobacteria bacterium]
MQIFVFKDYPDLKFIHSMCIINGENKSKGISSSIERYGLARSEVYHSWHYNQLEPSFPKKLLSDPARTELTKKPCNALQLSSNQILFSNARAAAEHYIHDRLDPDKKMQTIEVRDEKNTLIGSIEFREVGDVVYLAYLLVNQKFSGKGIGTRLVESVLSLYPEGTEFHILTRRFNAPAKRIYHEKLKFSVGDDDIAKKYGYASEDYFSFTKNVSKEDIEKVSQIKVTVDHYSFRQEEKAERALLAT